MTRYLALGLLIPLLAAVDVCADEQPTRPASLVQLIASPDEYANQWISVIGYMRPHSLELFLSEDLAQAMDWVSSVSVSDTGEGEITRSVCGGKYVEVRGFFSQWDVGHYGLRDVQTVRLTETGEMCWAAKEGSKAIPR